jgi:lipopolysaccharide export system protein LptA
MRIVPRRSIGIALAAALASAVGVADGHAQPKPKAAPKQTQQQAQPSGPPNALQGFSQNRNQPVKINAITLEVRDRTKMATFTGNVHLVQGDTVMQCKQLVIYYNGGATSDASGGAPAAPAPKQAGPGAAGSQQIRRMEASGGVVVTQKDQTAIGDNAVYDTQENTVRLFAPPGGLVLVAQGQNMAKGPRLVVHLDTGVSHFEGGVEVNVMPHSTPPAADAAGTRAATGRDQ